MTKNLIGSSVLLIMEIISISIDFHGCLFIYEWPTVSKTLIQYLQEVLDLNNYIFFRKKSRSNREEHTDGIIFKRNAHLMNSYFSDIYLKV